MLISLASIPRGVVNLDTLQHAPIQPEARAIRIEFNLVCKSRVAILVEFETRPAAFESEAARQQQCCKHIYLNVFLNANMASGESEKGLA